MGSFLSHSHEPVGQPFLLFTAENETWPCCNVASSTELIISASACFKAGLGREGRKERKIILLRQMREDVNIVGSVGQISLFL